MPCLRTTWCRWFILHEVILYWIVSLCLYNRKPRIPLWKEIWRLRFQFLAQHIALHTISTQFHVIPPNLKRKEYWNNPCSGCCFQKIILMVELSFLIRHFRVKILHGIDCTIVVASYKLKRFLFHRSKLEYIPQYFRMVTKSKQSASKESLFTPIAKLHRTVSFHTFQEKPYSKTS